MILYLDIISIILFIYSGLLGLYIILSWFPNIYQYKFFRGIYYICDWYMRPFHDIIVLGPIDFTPIIGIGIFEFIVSLISLI